MIDGCGVTAVLGWRPQLMQDVRLLDSRSGHGSEDISCLGPFSSGWSHERCDQRSHLGPHAGRSAGSRSKHIHLVCSGFRGGVRLHTVDRTEHSSKGIDDWFAVGSSDCFVRVRGRVLRFWELMGETACGLQHLAGTDLVTGPNSVVPGSIVDLSGAQDEDVAPSSITSASSQRAAYHGSRHAGLEPAAHSRTVMCR
jgi:hypothetical protein